MLQSLNLPSLILASRLSQCPNQSYSSEPIAVVQLSVAAQLK